MKKYIVLITLIVALFAITAYAVDTKLSGLTKLAQGNDDLLLYVVTDPNVTPLDRKIPWEELLFPYAVFTTKLTVDTGTVTLTGNVANSSVLTIGAGAVSVSGANTGDDATDYEEEVTEGSLADDTIMAADLKISNAETTGYALTAAEGGGFTWVELTGGAETNSLETTITGIATGEIFVGNGDNSGTFRVLADADIPDTVTVTSWTMGSSVATTPAANDADTSLATTAFCETTQDYLKTAELTAAAVEAALTNDPIDFGTGIVTAAGFAGPLTGAVTGNADTVTNATLTTALTVNTGTLTLTAHADNDSVLTIGKGAASVSGANTGDNTNATTVTITDNEDTAENNPIVFVAGGDLDGGNLGLESDGTAYYTPSTGKITATGFVGALTGNADTVTNATLTTALTVNTGTLTLTANVANNSVLTIGAGAVSVSGANTGDNTVATSGDSATDFFSSGEIADAQISDTLTSSSCTGTAAVATAVTAADESADTECFPVFVTAATGNLEAKTGTNLTFNSSTGMLGATILTTGTNIKAEPKHLMFNIINPLATQTEDNEICLWPVTPAAFTVTKIVVTLDAADNEVAGDLKYADTFIGLGTPVLINDFDTTSGVRSDDSMDAGAAGAVPAAKCLYITFDSAPNTAIKQMCVDITFDYD